jgi:hypothetical protein
MSFLKSLFGLGKSPKTIPPVETPSLEHKGFIIEANPLAKGREFQVRGRIWRVVDGMTREHELIRVDTMATRTEAIELTFRKGQQMIDQLGDRLFG